MTASLRLQEYIKDFELKESLKTAQVITESCSKTPNNSYRESNSKNLSEFHTKVYASGELKKYHSNTNELLTVDDLLCGETLQPQDSFVEQSVITCNNSRQYSSLPPQQRLTKESLFYKNHLAKHSLDEKKVTYSPRKGKRSDRSFRLCPHHRHVISSCTLDDQKTITSQFLDLKKVLNLIDDLKYDLLVSKQCSPGFSNQPDADVLDTLIQRLSKSASSKENKLCETLQQSFYDSKTEGLSYNDGSLSDCTSYSTYFAENRLCSLCESFTGVHHNQSKVANSTVLTTSNISEVMDMIDERQQRLLRDEQDSDSYNLLTSSPNTTVLSPQLPDQKYGTSHYKLEDSTDQSSTLSSLVTNHQGRLLDQSTTSLASSSTKVSIITKLIDNKPQSIQKFLAECLDKNDRPRRASMNDNDINEDDSNQRQQYRADLSSSSRSLQVLDHMITTLNGLSYSEEQVNADKSSEIASSNISSDIDAICSDELEDDSGSECSSSASFMRYSKRGKEYLSRTRSHFLALRSLIGNNGGGKDFEERDLKNRKTLF